MEQLRVRDLARPFGAEVDGFDPDRPLDRESIQVLRDAFDDRALLIFRDVDIDEAGQGLLSSILMGADETEQPPTAGRAPMLVSNKEPEAYAPSGRLLFHSEMMWHERPCQVLSLYGVRVEEPAVPTLLTSAKHAWDTLPADLRAQVEGLHAIHMTGQQRRHPDEDDDLFEPVVSHAMTTTPIGHRHPRTGEILLYISHMNTSEIVELPPEESEALLEQLFDHLYRPEDLYEHEWRERDLLVWDNFTIQHGRGTVETDGPVRTLRKVYRPVHRKAKTSQVANAG